MRVDDLAGVKRQITFGKFENIDLRVARVISATFAAGTKFPCRILEVDLGPLGSRTSVVQFALIPEEDLIGTNVVACVNPWPPDRWENTSLKPSC